MNHRTYGYHSSKKIITPRKTNANIKGIELEIGEDNRDDEYVNDALDTLIENNVIKAPYNEGVKSQQGYTIAIEDDGSVYKELIIKASCNKTLLKAVRKLENELHNLVENDKGTSCHIHINNEHLKKLGLTNIDIIKSAEFLAPILYEISGRDLNSLRWCRSRVPKNITDFNLFKRAVYLDNREHFDNERYRIVNKGGFNSKTTELRIFSNYYDFSYKYIKLYIEMTDFIIDLANKMKNKSYQDEYDNIIKDIFNFFNKRNRKSFYITHHIERFLIPKKDIKKETLRIQFRYFQNEIQSFRERTFDTDIEKMMSFIRFCRNYSEKYQIPNLKFDFFNINETIDNNINVIREDIENQIEEYLD